MLLFLNLPENTFPQWNGKNYMGDNFASPLYQFAQDSTPNSAVIKHEDPKKAYNSLEIHFFKIELWSDIRMISFDTS